MASKMKLNIESTGVLHPKKLRVGKGVPPGRQDESGNNFSQVEVYTTEFFLFGKFPDIMHIHPFHCISEKLSQL